MGRAQILRYGVSPVGGALAATSALLGHSPLAIALCLMNFGTLLSAQPVILSEDFKSDPSNDGWRIFGNTNLFQWNQAEQHLSVTWDSSQPNSYFYIPLGTILQRQDDFDLAVDLTLLDVTAGVTTNKPSTFELALGFLNLVEATRTNFFRGNSGASPDLVEFDFFPDTGFGPTVWPSVWSTNSTLNYNGSGDYTVIDLPLGVGLHVGISYASSNQTLTTLISTNGVAIGSINPVPLSSAFTDFRVGAFALESYSDAGQDPRYSGSLLAHGIVHRVSVTVPPPPVQNLAGRVVTNQWQATFLSRSNWLYTLERSLNFQGWTPCSATAPGNGADVVLADTNSLTQSAWYRIRAERP